MNMLELLPKLTSYDLYCITCWLNGNGASKHPELDEVKGDRGSIGLTDLKKVQKAAIAYCHKWKEPVNSVTYLTMLKVFGSKKAIYDAYKCDVWEMLPHEHADATSESHG